MDGSTTSSVGGRGGRGGRRGRGNGKQAPKPPKVAGPNSICKYCLRPGHYAAQCMLRLDDLQQSKEARERKKLERKQQAERDAQYEVAKAELLARQQRERDLDEFRHLPADTQRRMAPVLAAKDIENEHAAGRDPTPSTSYWVELYQQIKEENEEGKKERAQLKDHIEQIVTAVKGLQADNEKLRKDGADLAEQNKALRTEVRGLGLGIAQLQARADIVPGNVDQAAVEADVAKYYERRTHP